MSRSKHQKHQHYCHQSVATVHGRQQKCLCKAIWKDGGCASDAIGIRVQDLLSMDSMLQQLVENNEIMDRGRVGITPDK